jgi:hypothetical protein
VTLTSGPHLSVTDAKRKGRGERLGRRERRAGPVWVVGARERGKRKVDGLASFGLRREKNKEGRWAGWA